MRVLSVLSVSDSTVDRPTADGLDVDAISTRTPPRYGRHLNSDATSMRTPPRCGRHLNADAISTWTVSMQTIRARNYVFTTTNISLSSPQTPQHIAYRITKLCRNSV